MLIVWNYAVQIYAFFCKSKDDKMNYYENVLFFTATILILLIKRHISKNKNAEITTNYLRIFA